MTTNARSGRRVIGTVLALLGLPVALALAEAVAFHVNNHDTGTLLSSGEERTYLLHVPDRYDPATPAPLVVSLHGGAVWPAVQRDMSRWNTVADEHGFIVVYPSGIGGRGPRAWRVNRGPGLDRDITFIAELIDHLEAAYNIDSARIYADGLSNGAGMAFVLSCTLSDRIAAVGMVAAALLAPWDWCTDTRPVPMIAFHGTGDRLTPYQGGSSWVTPVILPDVPGFVASWARRNGCAADPAETAVTPDVSRRTYTDCAGNAAVVLHTIADGGHTWPGGTPLPEWFAGPTTRSIDATREMWAFFQQHTLHDGLAAMAGRARPPALNARAARLAARRAGALRPLRRQHLHRPRVGRRHARPAIFNPRALDARQWARARAKAAGFRRWSSPPSTTTASASGRRATTTHSVARSPWRGGQGDVVREFVDACRAEGLRRGALPLALGPQPSGLRRLAALQRRLLRPAHRAAHGYGPMHEVWFDGANGEGPNGKRQEYDWPRFWGTREASCSPMP
jgi:polyhydroxybutyrate depolymerase